MLVLVTYDVSTETSQGKKRLRDVAKACTKLGQRVQNSVFECVIDNASYLKLKAELSRLIEPKEDSLRFYLIGNRYESKVEVVGKEFRIPQDGLLLL